MSDLFSGIRAGASLGPDVILNQGPLPTIGSGAGPAYHGIPDSRINEASSLVGSLDPYTYAEPARMGSQAGDIHLPMPP